MNEVENNNNEINKPIENKQEKKPSNKGKVILFVGIILLVLTLGICGYFAYDKLFLNNNKNTHENENSIEYGNGYIFPIKIDSGEEYNFFAADTFPHYLTKEEFDKKSKGDNKKIEEINLNSVPKLNKLKLENLKELCYENGKYNESACEYILDECSDQTYTISLKNNIFEYPYSSDGSFTINNVKTVKVSPGYDCGDNIFVITNDGKIYGGPSMESLYLFDNRKYVDVKILFDSDEKEGDYPNYMYIFVGSDGKYYFTNGEEYNDDLAFIDESCLVDVNRNVYSIKKGSESNINYSEDYSILKEDYKYKFMLDWQFMILEDDNGHNFLYNSNYHSGHGRIYPSSISKYYSSNDYKGESGYLYGWYNKIEFENGKTLYYES